MKSVNSAFVIDRRVIHSKGSLVTRPYLRVTSTPLLSSGGEGNPQSLSLMCRVQLLLPRTSVTL